MRLRFLLALALGCTAGCDLSGPSVGSGTVTSGPGGNPTPGGTVLGPFLISIEPSPLEIAPGDEIRLNGINFSNVTIVDPQPAQKCRPFLSFLPVCTRTQCMPLEQLTGHVHIEGNGAGCCAAPHQ